MALTFTKSQIMTLTAGLLMFIGGFSILSHHFYKTPSVTIERDNTHGEILEGVSTEVIPTPTGVIKTQPQEDTVFPRLSEALYYKI